MKFDLDELYQRSLILSDDKSHAICHLIDRIRELEAYVKDAERFRFLYDEMGELIWYPPRWNGNPNGRFDLYWESEEDDLRVAIDEWIQREHDNSTD